MAFFQSLVNGVPRATASNPYVPVYDQIVTVVSGTPSSGNQIAGPITAGVAVTLPNSQTYTGLELEVSLNGQLQENVLDWNFSGTGAPYSAVSFTYQLVVGDVVGFRIKRAP